MTSNFLSNENLSDEARETKENESNNDFKPELVMDFATGAEVQKFFNLYTYTVEFSVSCVLSYHTGNKRRNNEVIRFTKPSSH
jgi:hypothetical protein